MTAHDSEGTQPRTWAAYVREVVGTDTQREIAAKVGCSQATVSRWMSNPALDSPSGLRWLNGFARAYGQDLGQVLRLAANTDGATPVPPLSGRAELKRASNSDLLRLQRQVAEEIATRWQGHAE